MSPLSYISLCMNYHCEATRGHSWVWYLLSGNYLSYRNWTFCRRHMEQRLLEKKWACPESSDFPVRKLLYLQGNRSTTKQGLVQNDNNFVFVLRGFFASVCIYFIHTKYYRLLSLCVQAKVCGQATCTTLQDHPTEDILPRDTQALAELGFLL